LSFKLLLNPKYESFKDHLLNIQNIFKSSDENIHKARNELKIVELNGIKYVVKSFKVPHIINRIAYTHLREGKAKKSFTNALQLQALHVNTPEPIGIIEFFQSGLLSESYFISVYEPYDFTIREVFHHKVEDTENILKEFAHFSYDLHQKGVWHVDYSLGNILITKQVDCYKFSLVDINRMQFKTITPQEGLKNFNKFWAKDKYDLIIIAKEYAALASFNEEKAVKIVLEEAKKLENMVNIKRKLKGK
jgi:serine/threonine protein kinase